MCLLMDKQVESVVQPGMLRNCRDRYSGYPSLVVVFDPMGFVASGNGFSSVYRRIDGWLHARR